MGRKSDSDEEYSVIGDKGDLGFIDIEDRKVICSYNPDNESDIYWISVPFPLVDGKPQSGSVGGIMCDSITIKNKSNEELQLWSVRFYDSKPEGSFTLSLMKPPTADSDPEYIEDFFESFRLEDRMLAPGQELIVWLSCKPKEIGVHMTSVYVSIDDDIIERVVFLLSEDSISRALSSSRPYQKPRRKNPDVVNVQPEDTAYIIGRRPSRGGGTSRGFRNRLPEYHIPADIRAMITSKQLPDEINMGLSHENYSSFFRTLVAMEEIKLEEDVRAYDMERVTMRSMRNQFLSLEVPGLAERRPSLVNGDYVLVRHATGDNNTSYQGYIHRVQAEEIYLKFEHNFHRSHKESNLYNVQFTFNRVGIRRLYQAVEAAEDLDINFLFPSLSSKMTIAKQRPLVPISCVLNEEQKKCVETIFSCRGGCPYLIHGPPGTGKTMTLVEALLQIYMKKKSAQVLVCAPSNNAADHILERLITQKFVQIQENEIFRLNAMTRPYEDVNPNHLQFCCEEDGFFKCPTRWDLVRYRIVISTYMSASLLHSEGIKSGHFSYFFLDEAGQASEPETMVPLSHLYSRNSVVVLAGDPRQLGPVVFSREAENYGMGTSYLERLFDCELYRTGGDNYMTRLVRNYRSHEAILSLPSELFYEGELIPCKKESTGSSSKPWDSLISKESFPLLFIGIQGCDEREGSNPSWFNRIEASKVVEIINILLENGMKQEDIGVITPYKQQVSKIRGALESVGTADTKVGSVEQFQGQEREVIVISTVRSTVKHNEFDRLHYLGFLSNPRRFNVAITRARSLLIVIGNPHILCKDPNWNKLLWYCVDNDSYKGCFLPKREDISSEVPAGNGSCNWSQGDQWQPSEPQWGQDDGGQWQPSESQWGQDDGGQWQPSDAQWGDGDQWKPSEVPWGDEAGGSNQKSSEDQADDWKPSEEPWNVDDNDPKGEGDNWKPSEEPWNLEDLKGGEDQWKPSEDPWVLEDQKGEEKGKGDWKPSEDPSILEDKKGEEKVDWKPSEEDPSILEDKKGEEKGDSKPCEDPCILEDQKGEEKDNVKLSKNPLILGHQKGLNGDKSKLSDDKQNLKGKKNPKCNNRKPSKEPWNWKGPRGQKWKNRKPSEDPRILDDKI